MRAFAIICAILLTAKTAVGCQCSHILSVAEALQGADAVFEGTVVEQEPVLAIDNLGRRFPSQNIRFAVHRVWKGKVSREVILAEGEGNCAMWLGLGDREIVFASFDAIPYGGDSERFRRYLSAWKCGQPAHPMMHGRSASDLLGVPLISYAARAHGLHGFFQRERQHVEAYLVAGAAVIQSFSSPGERLYSGFVRSREFVVMVSGLLLWFLLIGLVLRNRKDVRWLLASVVITSLLAVLLVIAVGASFLHNPWWGHLLEGWQSPY